MGWGRKREGSLELGPGGSGSCVDPLLCSGAVAGGQSAGERGPPSAASDTAASPIHPLYTTTFYK